MNWSYSRSRTFLQCPRKWYYQHEYADAGSKDTKRREAFFLSRLSNLRAWRGKITDQIITRFIVPRLKRHEQIDSQTLSNYTSDLINQQLQFGKAKSYRNDITSKFRQKSCYCAFFELEYGSGLSESAVQSYTDEINASLKNLLDSYLIKRISEDAIKLVAQRTLRLEFFGSDVLCTPDLIVFFKSGPPAVIDWKVESPSFKDHWLQLGIYGLVLSRVGPHKDFPADAWSSLKNPENIDLLEFQLLRNCVHNYKIKIEDITDIENFIYSTSTQMSRLLNGHLVNANLLPSTRNAENCLACNFRKLCWRISA